MFGKIFFTVILLLTVCMPNVEGRQFEYFYTPNGPTFNAVAVTVGTVGSDVFAYCAGENGLLERWRYVDGHRNGDPETVNLPNAENYNLTGISLTDYPYPHPVGYIVGYNISDPNYPKWTGAIWYTINGFFWQRLSNIPSFSIPTPFLDVHTVDGVNVWVSCGNGYVIRSTNSGEDWSIAQNKPGGDAHFGWLWGICLDPPQNAVWVCSDQSGQIAKTTNNGDNWDSFYPFLPHDSLAYSDVVKGGQYVYFAASDGKSVSCNQNGMGFNYYYPFDVESEFIKGILLRPSDACTEKAGTAGTYAKIDTFLWYTNACDFNDIGRYDRLPTGYAYTVAVGSNKSVLMVYETPNNSSEDSVEEDGTDDPIDGFEVHNVANDQGKAVYGEWEQFQGATFYEVFAFPAPARDLSRTPPPANLNHWKILTTQHLYFYFDNALTNYNTGFWIRAKDELGSVISDLTGPVYATPVDERPPQAAPQNLRGSYNAAIDACVLEWDPISNADEPNLGGYYVCPILTDAINHASWVYRTYYCERTPHGRTASFQVWARDRSRQWGPGSNIVSIEVLKFPSTSPFATAFNQGRHLVRYTDDLHMVYETDGNVMYSYSQDKGENWFSEDLGHGFFPNVGVNQQGLPWIAYWKNGDIVCKVKRPEGTWKELGVFKGNGTTSWAGAPAIAMGTIPEGVSPAPFAYITYPVYEGEGMPDMPAPGPHPSYYNCIKLSILDTVNIAHYSIDEGDADLPVSDPAVAVTPADLLHLVWQKGDEIYYATNYDKIGYDNFQQAQIQEKMNLSESPGVQSQHPFIESYGDRAFAAWKEGEPGEIYRRMRDLTADGITWNEPENISNSPDRESDYPVLATSDVVAYQEKIDDENYEIYAWIKGDFVNLSETNNPSKYPHIVVEPPLPTQPEILIDAIWTEEIRTDTLYEVKFKQYRHPINPDGFGEYISVTIGDSVASPYCEQRDGRIDYGEFSCDYDNSSLIYNIPYLNPISNYLLRAVVYKEGSQSGKEEVYVDTTFVTEVSYVPYIPETVYVLIPKETYENDFEIGKEIEKILGNYALLADLKVYEVSLSDSSGGGGQSAGSSRITRTVLYQNNPNPFKDLTKIAFALPKESKVSLFVYNVTGRRVRTLIDEKMKPGNYNLKWDGKDNQNRNLGQGIYFYRLQTEDFKDTKKTVLLK